ncbi:MAG: BMC domain-containing protein [Thermoanaerobaculia bacterium]|nr:BMC domain-containing protein [Thermoanaerobaculia bacterium]
MGELRCYCFIDSLPPQFASFLGTVAQGFLPVPGQASLFVEVAPGMDIMKVTDVALKATDVKPGMMIIERVYGMLEVHSDSQADVRQAGAAILSALDLNEADRIKPEITSSQVIRNISDYHTQLINRTRHGDMIVPGETLYVLECAPAGYAAIAANEAEKAANIKILEVRAFGSFGRVYLGGDEKDVDVAWRAAEEALKTISGRVPKKGRGE